MVTAALLTSGIIGIGQTAQAEDANTGFDLLNEIVEMWKRERFMAWRNVEQIIPATGALSYPLLDRPPRLDAAFARLLTGQQYAGINNAGPVDFPLYIIGSQEEYADISLKQLTTFPAGVWYSPDYPVGSVFFWPVPISGQFDLHVLYRSVAAPAYVGLTDPLGLPPEYIRALRYELATLLCLNYGLPPNPGHVAAMMGAKAQIKAVNAHVRNMQMPRALVPQMPGQGGISGSVGPHQSVIVPGS
jgi:hypothetical protein